MTNATQEKPAADKTKKEAKPKVARNSLHNLLWAAFKANRSFAQIIEEVRNAFPASKFNERQEMHYRYYRVKYNQERKAANELETSSEGPARKAAAPKVAKPAADKAPKAEKK